MTTSTGYTRTSKGDWEMLKYAAILVVVFTLLASVSGCAGQQAGSSPTQKQDAQAPKQETPAPKQNAPEPKQGAAAQKLEKITVAYATPSGAFAPVWMAKEAGLYEKYGLDVDLKYIAGAPVLVPAVIAGEVQFGQTAAPGPMNSYVQGGGTVWITAAVNTAVLYMVAAPSITKMEDLKGKSVGVTKYGSTTDTFTRLALKKYGLEPNKDVAILQTGGTPETLAALKAGQISASVNGPPTHLKALDAGDKVLLDIASLGIPYPFGGAFTTKKMIKERPDTVRKFVKAYVEALYLLKTDEKKAKEVIGKYTKTTDPKELDETYKAFVGHYEKVPIPTVEVMKTAIDEMAATNPKVSSIDPKEFFDDTFVKELQDNGFIDKLYEKK